MAGGMSYKGLTIRIGGDTAPLQRAIKEASSAARVMQGQLRRVEAGLRLDPTNMTLIAAKMGQLGEKAVLAGAKAEILHRHLKDIPSQALERARQDTGQLGARAAYAADQYNRLNEQIAARRRGLAMQEFGLDDSTPEKDIKAAVELYKEYEEQCRKTGKVADKELAELQARWHAVEESMESAKDAVRAKDMLIEIEKLEAETKQAAEQFVELKGKMMSVTGSNALQRARTETKLLGEAADDTRADLQQLDAALREGGNHAGTAAGKFLRLENRQDQLKQKAQQLRIQFQELRAQLDRPFDANSFKTANDDFAVAKANFVQIRTQAEMARAKVEGLKQEMALLGKPTSNSSEMELKRLQQETLKATEKMRRLSAEEAEAEKEFNAAHTVREMAKIQTELRQTTAQARAAESAMNGISAKNWYIMRSVGTVMMSTFTPALSMGLSKIAEASDTLDAAWRDMRKTVNGTEEDFQHLKDSAIEFSKTHVTTADQILEIEAMGGQLGIAVENLEAFGTTVANLDIATNMQSDEISEDLGKLANILGMSVDEYDNFGDALVRLGNNEAALEGDVMKITTRFAGMGKIVGMSGDQVLAWATAATATGQKAEAAGSSMQRFISNMETAVNGSEEDLAEWAKIAGMSGQEFKKSFGEDASGTMYRFIEGLAKIQKSGGSVNQALMNLGITGVRDKQLLEGLAQQMVNATSENNVLKDSLEMSANAWNGISDKWGDAGDAMNEAEKKSQGFSGSLGKLKNTATALASSAGNSLVPWMNKITELLGGVQEGYAAMPESGKQMINTIGAIVTAMGPMMMIVGAAGQGLTSFKKSLAENGAAALNSANAVKVFDAQLRIDEMQMHKTAMGNKKLALERKGFTASNSVMIQSYQQEMEILDQNIKKQEQSINRTKKMAGAMKALKTVGIVAGISAAVEIITVLVSKYMEAKKHADLLAKSDKKLEQVFGGFKATNEVNELGKVTKSLKEVREYTDEAAQAQIDMVDEFTVSMQDAYNKSTNLDSLVTKIQTLSAQSNLSKEQVDDLRGAVNQLNEATGSEWMVTDEGKIMDQQKTMSELTGSMEALVDAYNKVNGTELTIAEDGWVSDANVQMQDLLDAVNELNGTDFTVDPEGNIVSASGKFNDMAVEIRDVVTATNELKEAQDRLWTRDVYEESYKKADENARRTKMRLDEANDAYLQAEQKRKEILDSFGGDITRAAGNAEYGEAAKQAEYYRQEVSNLTGEWQKFSTEADMWKGNMDSLDNAIANNGESIEGVLTRFRASGENLAHLGFGIDDMANAMKGLGITFDDVADLSEEDVERITDSWDGNMGSLVDLLQNAGVKLDDTTLAMAKLADESGISAPKISEMWEAFGGDVGKVQAAVEVLNETGIDPKNVEFKDNTLVVSKRISDLDKKKIEDKGFKVDDENSIVTMKDGIDKLTASLNALDGSKATVGVSVTGKSAVDAVLDTVQKIFGYNGKTSTVGVKTGGRATGAVVTRNARGRAFDGVISRPTLTNIGWVGEAGAEWVDSANGRVIPLTNRKYMVPIAREIAAGLNGYSGGRRSVNVSVSLNYSAGSDANQMATDLTRALRRKILMEG